jgi:predicted Fe-Mo cluster-binding NifX family protein
MTIAIPVNDNSKNTDICISFGRAPFFMLYDIESGEYDFLENRAATAQGGAGIKAAQSIADSGVGALLSPRLKENAADVLTAAKINLYRTESGSVQENIKAFKEGRLQPLNDIHKGFHGNGGR